jgi:5-formyltetrahydrofolate cyclo-ligase
MEKQQLRRELLARREGLPLAKRQVFDAAICRRVQELPEWQAAETVFLYLDFRGEVSTKALVETLLEHGKKVCAPVTRPVERQMLPVRLLALDEVRQGAYGIREPLFREEALVDAEQIDLVILPGVGFDRAGGRLGYGGGYYDRFLPKLSAKAKKIALAYECQVLPELPREPHDVRVDLLVTEKGVWRM